MYAVPTTGRMVNRISSSTRHQESIGVSMSWIQPQYADSSMWPARGKGGHTQQRSGLTCRKCAKITMQKLPCKSHCAKNTLTAKAAEASPGGPRDRRLFAIRHRESVALACTRRKGREHTSWRWSTCSRGAEGMQLVRALKPRP